MCGRYYCTCGCNEILERFAARALSGYAPQPAYNIKPTSDVPVVLEQDGGRILRPMRWWLETPWTKTKKNSLFNATAERVPSSSLFSPLLRRRRCLIPATGFYEWPSAQGGTRPFVVRLKSGELFAFAGLWTNYAGLKDAEVYSCTIITTTSNELMKSVHHRMPVIIPRAAEALWLDHTLTTPEAIKHLLAPYPSDDMEAYEVAPLVGDSPELTWPVSR
ncbi:MAG: SOS response-associated peptidase [Dehalococcoidia bacterium]|nr:SOS response-associated peptidase [Dehalococcoidia bacterium]